MSARDDEIRIRPGRIRPGHRGASRPRSFVGEVMRAAKKPRHTGKGSAEWAKASLARASGGAAAPPSSSRSHARRVVIMTRVVRHRGRQFIAAPLAKQVAYLKTAARCPSPGERSTDEGDRKSGNLRVTKKC
jgi:hypothetical protein